MRLPFHLLLALLFFAGACATSRQEVRQEPQRAAAQEPTRAAAQSQKGSGGWQEGIASYYADSLHGRTTANGQIYDKNAATCAHRSLRFGTRLEVVVVDSGRRARCRVNDRGPFVEGRIVDVSRAIAEELGMIDRGVARVRIRPIE